MRNGATSPRRDQIAYAHAQAVDFLVVPQATYFSRECGMLARRIKEISVGSERTTFQ